MEIYHEKLFKAVVDEAILTKDYLYTLGIDDDDINKFLERGHMIKIGDTYQYVNVDALILYARSLIRNKDFERSYRCFDLCIKLDRKNYAVNFELFKRAIDDNKYDEALKYFIVLYENSSYSLKAELNTYLFLLSYICVLPRNLKAILNSLKREDLLIDESANNFYGVEFHNLIRSFIYGEQFVKALGVFNVMKSDGKRINFPTILIKKLVYKALDNTNNKTEGIMSALEDKNYDLILSLLADKKTTRITRWHFFMKKIATDIIRLQNGEDIVVLEASIGDTLFTCIKKGDYNKALELLEVNDTYESFIIETMLIDVCELLEGKNISSNNQTNQLSNEVKQMIIKLIVLEGVSIDEACKQFDLNYYQSAIINLIFAREYYSVKEFDYGDKIMASIKNKLIYSDTIKALYGEIIANRDLYSAMVKDGEVPFMRLLKKETD